MSKVRKEDMADAIDFIERRTAVEASFKSKVDAIIEKYAASLIDLGYMYNISPKNFAFSVIDEFNEQVEELLGAMQNEIYDLIEECALSASSDESDRKWLLLVFLSLGNGLQDVQNQLSEYVMRFKKEIEAFIAAGLLGGTAKSVLLASFSSSMHSIWSDPIMRSAFRLPDVAATALRTHGVSYGRGRSNVFTNMVERLGIGSIALTWWQFDTMDMKRSGAIGYMQYRGSSYPCEICDAEARFHPIEEVDLGYPHAYCKCFRVPVYEGEI